VQNQHLTGDSWGSKGTGAAAPHCGAAHDMTYTVQQLLNTVNQ